MRQKMMLMFFVLLPSWLGEMTFTARQERSSEITKPVPSAAITSLAISPEPRFCAIGREDGAIEVVLVADLQPVWECRGHEGQVLDLEFLSDGTLVSAGQDGVVNCWKPNADFAFEMVGKYQHSEGGYLNKLVLQNGDRWVVGSAATVFQPGREAGSLERIHELMNRADTFALSRDSAWLAVPRSPFEFELREFGRGSKGKQQVFRLEHRSSFRIKTLEFSPNGESIVVVTSGRTDSKLWMINLATSDVRPVILDSEDLLRPTLIADARFTIDGRGLIVCDGDEVFVIDVESGGVVERVSAYVSNGHQSVAEAIQLDGSIRVFSGASDGRLYVFSILERR